MFVCLNIWLCIWLIILEFSRNFQSNNTYVEKCHLGFESRLVWSRPKNTSAATSYKLRFIKKLIMFFFVFVFVRKLFQSTGLYIKGILNGRPVTVCLVNSGNVSVFMKLFYYFFCFPWFVNFGEICHNNFLATSWECVLRFIRQEIGVCNGFVGAILEIEPVVIDFAIKVVETIGYDVHTNF